jgi:hypothetical protein
MFILLLPWQSKQAYKDFYSNKRYVFFINSHCHPEYIHIVYNPESFSRRILYNLINNIDVIKLAVLNSSLGFVFSVITMMNVKMCNIKRRVYPK